MLDLPLLKCNLNILNNSSINILNNNLNKQIGLSIYEIKINKSTELPLNFSLLTICSSHLLKFFSSTWVVNFMIY